MSKNDEDPPAGPPLLHRNGEILSSIRELGNVDLPEELSTQEAARVLGCCKHTVLQFQEEGLLEWRNAAPPSSQRPLFRFTLRSVLELRLAYQRGSPRPPGPFTPKLRPRRSAPATQYQPKHLRRKMPPVKSRGAEEEPKQD